MFRKYLGLEQYFSTVTPSEYKPSQAKDTQAQYVRFNPQQILDSMFNLKGLANFDSSADSETSHHFSDFEPAKDRNFKAIIGFVEKHQVLPPNSFTGQLGKYKAFVGFDSERNERYISYYDKWDMDPPQLKKLGINVDQFNFPYEVYGRIYEKDVVDFFQLQKK
jgi:hypothetical protein